MVLKSLERFGRQSSSKLGHKYDYMYGMVVQRYGNVWKGFEVWIILPIFCMV